MRNQISVLLFLSFFISCSKEKTDNIVEGKWKWVETVPVVAPPLIPQSTTRPAPGEIHVFDFRANQNFTYKHNDLLLRSGSYSIDKNIYGNYPLLFFSDDPAMYSILNQGGDTLALLSNVPGAGLSKYSKY